MPVPRRRKVDNPLALAVLSVVVERPMHPYQMASMIRARGKEKDMKIKWGSLYTVVQNMEKYGLLETVGSTRHGRRPERTIYRITDAGRGELEDWTRELISVPAWETTRFEAGLSVMGGLGPDEATRLLQGRLRLVELEIAGRKESLTVDTRQIPRLFLIEEEYRLAIRQAEAAWLRALLQELTAASFPGLEQWRAWRATGQVPAELTELAERGTTNDQLEVRP